MIETETETETEIKPGQRVIENEGTGKRKRLAEAKLSKLGPISLGTEWGLLHTCLQVWVLPAPPSKMAGSIESLTKLFYLCVISCAEAKRVKKYCSTKTATIGWDTRA